MNIAATIIKTGAKVIITDEKIEGCIENPNRKMYLVTVPGRPFASGWVDAHKVAFS